MVLHQGIRFRVVAQPCREPRKWRPMAGNRRSLHCNISSALGKLQPIKHGSRTGWFAAAPRLRCCGALKAAVHAGYVRNGGSNGPNSRRGNLAIFGKRSTVPDQVLSFIVVGLIFRSILFVDYP